MVRNFNPTLFDEAMGAAGMAANIVLSPVTRPWYSRWGSSAAERQRPLPGDEIVSSPRIVSTRAITIHAPAGAIWPWLAQMGQGRGGLYSYQKLENLARCDMHNADVIHPEWQNPNVGDKVRFGPEPYPFHTIRAIDPGRTFVLGSPVGDLLVPTSWVFHLEPIDAATTRLITRYRSSYEASIGNVITWRALTDPIFFVMERRMLIGIRDRAEARREPAAAVA
ncbi:MAG: hypothetical protein KA170_02890 [Candidatus Promineofilum sp.]|nr:hypothetical protein [Promineifilum sp.]